MEFKDYYATLGVAATASAAELKRAYRKLARKYHPDVSKEPNAEARFKEISEAHEALIDTERRAAYDDIAQRHARGEPYEPPAGWDAGSSARGPARRGHARDGPEAPAFSDFFDSIFGRAAGAGPGRAQRRAGADHHAQVVIELLDAYRGAERTLSLRVPVADAQGRNVLQDRQLHVTIPRGLRQGQQLRLAGQGSPGFGGGPAGDLYLEIQFAPHPHFRVDGRDVTFDLPLAPWEAALGATVKAATPAGDVELSIPPGSTSGRKLRLKGRGLPAQTPGDLYALLAVAWPPAATEAEQEAYRALALAFPGFNPRTEAVT